MHSIILVPLLFTIIVIETASIQNSYLSQSVESSERASSSNVRQGRIFFEQLAQIPGLMPPMLPIEINVPDTIMGMWNGLMVMWNAMQEYFSSENSTEVESRVATLLELIL